MNVRFVKSFSTYCVATSLVALALLLAQPGELQAGKKKPAAEDLTNFLLAPEYSQWLVGAIGRMASAAEIQAFLALTADDEAAAFVEKLFTDCGKARNRR